VWNAIVARKGVCCNSVSAVIRSSEESYRTLGLRKVISIHAGLDTLIWHGATS
jgi:hypothetical protein